MNAKKGIEYDMYTDSIYTVPQCPHCEYPMLHTREDDIGKTVRCFMCDKEVRIPDEPWVREYFEDNVGEKEEETKCLKCGGTFVEKYIKRKGKWRAAYGYCRDCGYSIIVLGDSMRCKKCHGLARDEKGYICLVAMSQKLAKPKIGPRKLPSGEWGCSRHDDYIDEVMQVWRIITPPEKKKLYTLINPYKQS